MYEGAGRVIEELRMLNNLENLSAKTTNVVSIFNYRHMEGLGIYITFIVNKLLALMCLLTTGNLERMDYPEYGFRTQIS